MVDGNNSAEAGTADTQADSQVPHSEAELEDEIGAAFEASLADSEQADEPQKAKPADGETEESNEEAEEKTETEDEEDPKKELEKPTTVKLKDGTEVTFEELEKGFLRQSDYTRKTQEVANDRKALEAAAQRLIQQDQIAKQDLTFARAAIEALLPKPPDPSMLSTDPVGFLQAKEAYEQTMQKLNRIRQGESSVNNRLQEHTQAQTREQRDAEMQALIEHMPALRTEQGRNAFFQEASEIAGKAYGFTAEEIGSFTDHRYIRALRDAVEYRKLQGKKMEAVRKAKEAPPMKPAARQAPSVSAKQSMQAALERARRTGSIEDVAATVPDELFN